MTRPEIPIGAVQARHAADRLQALAQSIQAGDPLDPDLRSAARAALDHVARELCAQYGLQHDGDPAVKHDRLDWLDLAIYVNDPF